MTPGKHNRSNVRARAVELLKQFVDVGQRVYASRPEPIWETQELPLVLVYFTEEPAEHRDRRPRYYMRMLTLNVDIISNTGLVELDTFLDDRAYEAELAMLHDETLALPFVHDVILLGTRPVVYDYESASNKAIIQVRFQVEYETEVFTQATIEEFLRFQNKIETTDGAESEDLVTIREE